MKKNCLFTLCLLLSCICSAQQNDTPHKEKLSQERLKLKNFAFCQCLQHVYKNDSVLIIDGSSSGYFETGAYGIDAYNTIDSVANIYSLKVYKSKEGHPLGIMKCLDFYNSNELDKLIQQFDNDIIKQGNNKKRKAIVY
ncbi:MAG TPA: T6SS amidase immunity protein Tai4 family protein [Bacteroidales bacterium]|mgnify:CR=1 FL=1|nr:T6SS amidase immunity protein Tai4 family protein [Bacteroidales bacterium]